MPFDDTGEVEGDDLVRVCLLCGGGEGWVSVCVDVCVCKWEQDRNAPVRPCSRVECVRMCLGVHYYIDFYIYI